MVEAFDVVVDADEFFISLLGVESASKSFMQCRSASVDGRDGNQGKNRSETDVQRAHSDS
ncbi:MAG: hypothetical protein CVU22_13590 [Betaproteobacteria bacterium HGW-Betaproteobacteria-16]|nr:MAG: hypothetical protein CVU22_13590 [Betaproteobacteria bacterium HGW-Betaproteobacteria-16]